MTTSFAFRVCITLALIINGSFHLFAQSGCTDELACNYDPSAIVDDGTCSGFPGCTNSSALNYDHNATCDDGLCIYDGATSCPGDLDGNAVVNANDLLGFLVAFGTTCP